MSNVPTNLIPSTITQLPEYTGTSTLGYLAYSVNGRTYKVQFSNIAAVGAVPSTRVIATGNGLQGGGDLSQDRTISIISHGVGYSQLDFTGVAAGTYGAADTIPVLTVDATGRVSSVVDTPVALANYVPSSRTVTAGAGLTGGGQLDNNITIALNPSNATPLSLGVASAGTGVQAARDDHVHPAVDLTDTSETRGVLPLGRGGTGIALSPVAGAVIYADSGTLEQTTAGNAGQVLTSAGGAGAPYWTDAAAGTVTSVDLTAGTGISVSGGPITTFGAITVTNTAPDQVVSLTAGSNITVTGTYPNFTIAATGGGGSGTVTSVGLAAPTGFTVSNSPVTTSGTLTLAFSAGYSLPTTASQTNWDTAYSERQQWDGGSTNLVAATGRTSLGATTVGGNLFTLANPSAITFLRVNADNTVSALSAATFRTAIGAGTGDGTVTSVGGTGTVNGITLTGTVTSSGSLTLGGTLSGVSLTTQVTGTLPVGNGGTNATTAAGARTNILPSYTGNAGKVLAVNVGATDVEWISAGGTGTVTSVSGTGTVNGITLTGTVTSSGSLTLGGTLSGVSLTTQVTGTLPVGNGGTGATTLTGLVLGNGTSAFTTVTAPSGAVVGTTDTQTLTNKDIVERVVALADATSITPNADTTDIATQANTQAAGTLTVNAPTGTLVNGQKLIIRLTCTNAQTFSFNGVFAGSTDLALPTATSGAGKTDYLGFIYNTTAVKWQLLAKNFGF